MDWKQSIICCIDSGMVSQDCMQICFLFSALYVEQYISCLFTPLECVVTPCYPFTPLKHVA